MEIYVIIWYHGDRQNYRKEDKEAEIIAGMKGSEICPS